MKCHVLFNGTGFAVDTANPCDALVALFRECGTVVIRSRDPLKITVTRDGDSDYCWLIDDPDYLVRFLEEYGAEVTSTTTIVMPSKSPR